MAPPMHYHVFSLPKALLDTLTPPNLLSKIPEPQAPGLEPVALPAQQVSSGFRSCNVCPGASFLDVGEHRAHYHSDWHRYNVKLRLSGGLPVVEPDFTKLVDSLEDSISGSASSSEDDNGSDGSDAVLDLLHKAQFTARSRSSSPDAPRAHQTPVIWFHSPPATQIGIYRLLFPIEASSSLFLAELRAMQGGDRKWALFMTAGGHFAGAIVRVSREQENEINMDNSGAAKHGNSRRPRPDTEILKHKTFHRYTTRRKQGGSQSTNDNAKSKAVSAGAMLRRYGEQALRDDIRNLLSDWADEIQQCERIWIRASASNRKIFLDYEGAVLKKGDDRLRTFPFPTRRPTQAELERCLQELTRAKVSHLTEDALRARDEEYLASLPRPKPKPQPIPVPTPEKEKERVPKLSKEEELFRDKWTRLLDMVERGRLDALKAFWERECEGLGGPDAPLPQWTPESARSSTLLQFAARHGQADVVQWMLEDLGADPTVPVPNASAETRVRTAYDEASSKDVRDAFRRLAGAYPTRWDWLGAGHVPSVLEQAKEDEREERKKARRKGLRDKLREREKERASEPEPEPEPTPAPPVDDGPGPRRLGGASGSAEGLAGLSPEMRLKVERERRARAVEGRMRALGGK
ncbi:hypothetical protein K488DRAFT_52396 [Vararia minispora EC-137]|uniref:Uncharacterized protein n=1 Tax=Vararia minispora EC-137 TaxID=1314806 RepID=A0ACB8QI10_9AGAM|nr:hypothetical protein K488DRAFT_52396 [Vararia minispora EC-137]